MTTMDAAFDLSGMIDRVEPGKLYRSAIEEVAESIAPVVAKSEAYQKARVFERLLVPDRVIRFRVEWVNDKARP